MTKTPFELTQLVAVRRDMPLIQVPVQGGHAIGIATYEYARTLFDEPGADASAWGHPFRLWCGVRNERVLQAFAERLTKAGLRFAMVTEPDDDLLKGQMTALCTHPYEKDQLLPVRGEEVFDLRLEQVTAFKNAAIDLASKLLLSQLNNEKRK